MKKKILLLSTAALLLMQFQSPFLFSYSSVGSESESGGKIVLPSSRLENVFRLKSFLDSFEQQLDPMHADSSIFVSEQMFEGLVRLDKEFRVLPVLAQYWDASPDGKRSRFYLRENVMFHHGEEMSAHDVKFSLERLIDPKTNSPYSHILAGRVTGAEAFIAGKAEDVSGFKVIDRYTFEIQWTKPFVSALYLLGMHYCKILPQNRLLERGEERFFREPSGTGPFEFDAWVRDTRLNIVGVRLVRYDDYYGSIAWLDAVEFCPHFTLDHFMDGQIDSIPVLTDRLLKKDSDYVVIQDGSLFPVYLGMSCHIAPLDNPLVRKAISIGVDKSEIIRATHEVQYFRQLLYSHIPPKLPGFRLYDSRTTYNLSGALDLLQQAGFAQGEERITLTLLLESPRTDFKINFHRELRNQLRELNIDLRLTYYRSVDEVKRFDQPYLILQGRLMDFPDPAGIIRPMFFSQSPDNVLGFSSPELDDYLEQAEVEHSWTKRNKLFLRIDQLLQKEIPSLPLYMQQNQVAMQPYVRGVEIPPMGLAYLKARNIWYEKEE